MVEKKGWRSLEFFLSEQQFDVVGINESHTLYIHEAIRAARLIRKVSPHTKIIGGGVHMTNCAPTLIRDNPFDFIIKGEGEYAFRDWLREAEKIRPVWSDVRGLVWLDEARQVRVNPPQPLIRDLDSLPMPAYHLLPVREYGKSRYLFSPGGMTIHHSRGCVSDCEFCTWWTQMARRKPGAPEGVSGENPPSRDILTPAWRTKSVERTLEEIEMVRRDYGKYCFLFTDDSWNISARWNDQFGEEILRRGLKIEWFAFMRADFLLRDEKNGINEKLVRSGLVHFCTGVEHPDESVLNDFNKNFYSPDDSARVVEIFRKKYPRVFIQTTFIVGGKRESRESLRRVFHYARKLKADFPGFHVLTPFPGTRLHEKFKEQGVKMESDLTRYDLNTPIVSTDNLSREELAWEVYRLFRKIITMRWLLRGLFSPYGYKRRMYIWWLIVTWRIFKDMVREKVFSVRKGVELVVPDWYEK